MKTTRLLLVGGFLGAGKTTLLFEATNYLMQKGFRIGLITNDQAPELVDTDLLLQTQVKVEEVSGSCFCCNLNGFIHSPKQVQAEAQADVIIAEPVGSCTDLSATIIQPLKVQMNAELSLSPLSVLADPMRLEAILEGGTAGLHPSAAYIFRKQLEESDLILISKTDLLQPEKLALLKEKVKLHFPDSEVLTVSAKTGEGIDTWLNLVLNSTKSGQRIVEVDYDKYAEGEAALGWLNSTIQLNGDHINWDNFSRNFLTELGKTIDKKGFAVGHVKIMLESETGYLVGNITGKIETLNIRGSVGKSNEARMIINARVGTNPELLEKLVMKSLVLVSGNIVSLKIKAAQKLRPGYPNPTFRYEKVVGF